MEKIEHADAGNLDWNIRGLKTGRRRELGVKLRTRILNISQERAAGADARR